MSKVDFYLLPETSIESIYIFVCRLLDKIYQQNLFAFLYVNTEAEAKILDDLLWTFKDDGFIPHCLLRNAKDVIPKISIGYDADVPSKDYTVFVNLTSQVPESAFQCDRIVEFVVNETKAKTISRNKYRIYREKNCDLNTQDLTKTSSVSS